MKRVLLSLLGLSLAAAQAPESPMPSYANFSIMLVSPAPPNGSVVLMHNPKNGIELVNVNNTKAAFANGYVPVRAAELEELITAIKEENESLKAENARLRSAQPNQQLNETNCHDWSWLVAANDEQRQTCAARFYSPSPAQLAAEQKAQEEAEKRDRRQQLIEAWLMLQAMRPPTPVYQSPLPAAPLSLPVPRMPVNCTTQTIGDFAYTNCN